MSAYKEFYQTPGELRDYNVVLETEDDDEFDPTYSAFIQITPADGELEATSVTYNAGIAKVWLQNGAVDADYWIRVRLRTTAGRIVNEEFEVKIRKQFPAAYDNQHIA